MWAMSDRGIPRSYRTMEGFGIHTFRLINAEGKATFVRFHWKPVAGKASLVWDEAQKLTGRDPDFHRRDLWEAIEAGDYPEFELGLQLIPEENEFDFDFDLLDPTKLIPEALVPVQRVGKMVLNRNPDNFFAENEQAAFHPGHIVPGIDFSNDPLLQGRLFSTPIRKLAAWVGRTSMKSPSTVRPARITISSATGCTGWTLTPIRPTTSPTRLTTTGRARRRQPPNAAALSPSPSASTAKNPPAQPFVRRILRPAASVLAEPDAD
jgi:catalase